MADQPAPAAETPVERVQLGVRMEKRMVKVLKGLAEFQNVSLGQLLENIVLHSFEPMPGAEGEWAASPHGKRALAAIADLKRVYGMDYDAHAAHGFRERDGAEGTAPAPPQPRRARDA
ncbi:MAG: hypothetical protein KJ048_19050 [Dehalococcoidia bacterium]|nr:hypothetical protein [Dehalococcoidia bacterium]